MTLNIDEIYSNDNHVFHKMSVEISANKYNSIEFIIQDINELMDTTNLNLNDTNLAANDLFKFYADTIVENLNLYKYLYFMALKHKSKYTIFYSSTNLVTEKTSNAERKEYKIDDLTDIANKYIENLEKDRKLKADAKEAKILKQNLLNFKNKLKEQGLYTDDAPEDINFGF